MRRYITTKPAWRARAPQLNNPRPIINIWQSDYDAIKAKAARLGRTMSDVADEDVRRLLAEAGVP